MAKFLVGAIISIVTLCSVGTTVSAQAYEYNIYNDQLEVRGEVLPVQQIIVDEASKVLEIHSNTTEDITPRVYRDRISKDTQIDLTDPIYHQFREIVPLGASKVGVLYKKVPAEPANERSASVMNKPLLSGIRLMMAQISL